MRVSIYIGYLLSDETAGHETVVEAYQKDQNFMDHDEGDKGKDQKCGTQKCLNKRSKELGELSNK